MSLILSDEPCQDLTSLLYLNIVCCPNFVSFPRGRLPAHNLITLAIWNCKKLKLLPEQMQDFLPSLRHLYITDCPELESFPDGGLPCKLSVLNVKNCSKLVAHRMDWNLQRFQALTEFSIGGECEGVESFPENGLLPTTVASLEIDRLSCLKTLDIKSLQQLTYLTFLGISWCPQLHELPEEGLPTSLAHLRISGCPTLKERCQRERGEDWNKISHISRIEIDLVCI